MGMLDGLVGQLAREAAGNALEKQGGLGGLLGGLVRGQQGTMGRSQAQTVDSPFGQSANTGGGLGDLLGSVLGGGNTTSAKPAAQGGAGLLIALLPVILNWVQQQGGLEKVLASLQSKGLGGQAQSWMSTGQNQPIQPEQVESVFGTAQVDQFAAETGANRGAVLSGIASLLPQVIDQLTPKGDTSTANEANQEIGTVLGQLAGLMQR
ncbi:MAG: YidB family protein [Pseudomonadota bacterium]|nr:YidB family protein [Pseudomonadota bacterium]